MSIAFRRIHNIYTNGLKQTNLPETVKDIQLITRINK